MNYLQLCQRLIQESGIADSGPSSVTGQVGDMRRAINWISGSWLKIQSMRKDWYWMWGQTSTTLVGGDSTFTPSPALERIEFMRLDGNLIQQIDYLDYARVYFELPTAKPNAFTIRPDGKVAFNAVADKDYSINYDYYRSPTSLTANNDVPGLPDRYHMLLVWDSLVQYAQFDVAPELERKGVLNFEHMLADLHRDQLPELSAPETLA